MARFIAVALSALLALAVAYPEDLLSCLVAPSPTLQAGQSASLILVNLWNRTCEATLEFDNEEFLPLHYTLKPTLCAARQEAVIPIPKSAPNGMAYLLWWVQERMPPSFAETDWIVLRSCAGQVGKSCVVAEITGGTEDADQFLADRDESRGAVRCLSTFTTLATVTTSRSPAASAIVANSSSTVVTTSGNSSRIFTPEAAAAALTAITNPANSSSRPTPEEQRSPTPTPQAVVTNLANSSSTSAPGRSSPDACVNLDYTSLWV